MISFIELLAFKLVFLRKAKLIAFLTGVGVCGFNFLWLPLGVWVPICGLILRLPTFGLNTIFPDKISSASLLAWFNPALGDHRILVELLISDVNEELNGLSGVRS